MILDDILKQKGFKMTNLKDLWIALRPLSLTLALASTTTGIVAAINNGAMLTYSSQEIMLLSLLITIAGLLAQSGANLINDYFEGSFRYHRDDVQDILFLGALRSRFDILVFILGMFCFALAAIIGIYLVLLTNLTLLWIGFIGVLGAYAYTGEPFVYKRKGLGVPLSFIIMGPLMVIGAYIVFSHTIDGNILLISLPISFLIPALMFSNELRDFQRDKGLSLGTLSVRIGSTRSKLLYLSLLAASYFTTFGLILISVLPWHTIIVVLTLPLAYDAYRSVATFQGLGIPKTNRLHFSFSMLYLICLYFRG